ncbi:MAG: hypothetical protein AB7T06_29215 [Kofleriaceae bacterium]
MKTHAPHPDAAMAANLWTLCGRYASNREHLAVERVGVTCRDCERLLGQAPEIAAPFEVEIIERERPGARGLDGYGARAIAASMRPPTDAVRPWATSAEAAVRRYCLVHDEGAALRSTCDPDRANRVQTSSDPSLGGREHAAVEHVATVTRALDAALELPLAISEACPTVTPRQARDVYLLFVCGRASYVPTRVGTKHLARRRAAMSARDVVLHLIEEHGLRLCHADAADCQSEEACAAWSERNLYAIRSLFTRVVAAHLRESGELVAREAPARAARRWDPLAKVGAR